MCEPQVPPKLSSLQPGLPHETSTPVDSGKRETRVRFAPHINTTFPTSEGDAPDAGAALPDTSSVSPQVWYDNDTIQYNAVEYLIPVMM